MNEENKENKSQKILKSLNEVRNTRKIAEETLDNDEENNISSQETLKEENKDIPEEKTNEGSRKRVRRN